MSIEMPAVPSQEKSVEVAGHAMMIAGRVAIDLIYIEPDPGGGDCRVGFEQTGGEAALYFPILWRAVRLLRVRACPSRFNLAERCRRALIPAAD
jgi:hypothetical protein